MIISKTFTKDLLDVMGRAADQLSHDYGTQDRLAVELRECCQRLLADGVAKRDLETRAKLRRITMAKKRNTKGHFVK